MPNSELRLTPEDLREMLGTIRETYPELRLIAGKWYELEAQPPEVCPLTAAALAQGACRYEAGDLVAAAKNTIFRGMYFWAWDKYGSAYARGFVQGLDGISESPEYVDGPSPGTFARYQAGYQDGKACLPVVAETQKCPRNVSR